MAESGKSQFVPKGMRVTAERLAAFTRNRFRIENAGSNSALPGQIITVTLPSNTLVDLHSLKMHGTFQARGGGIQCKPKGDGDTSLSETSFNANVPEAFAVKPVPPEDMHQLISRMTVSANGTAIQQGCIEYNTVHKVKSTLDRPKNQRETVDNAIGFADSHPVHATNLRSLEIRQVDNPSVRPLQEYGEHGTTSGKQTSIPTTTLTAWFDDDGTPRSGNAAFQISGDNATNYSSTIEERTLGNPHGADLSAGEKLVGLDRRDFTLYDWRGFCKESSVRYLPTDLVGALQLQITLAGPEVMCWFGRHHKGVLTVGDYRALHGTGQTSQYDMKLQSGVLPASYEISNIYWTVDTISVDQAYGDMLRGKIAQYGYISLLFKEYYTFFKSGWRGKNENHRFSLAAGSMDRMYTVLRNAKYNHGTQQAHQHQYENNQCYSPMFQFVCPSLTTPHNYGLPFDVGSTVKGYTQAYPPRPPWHFNTDTDMNFNYKVNSVMHPQYECSERDAIWDCCYGHDLVDGPNAGNQIESRAQWFEEKAIFPLNLNLTDGPLQLMSGYDSRGHSSFVEFNINGLTFGCEDDDCMNNYKYMSDTSTGLDFTTRDDKQKAKAMFPAGLTTTTIVETTSELRIGAGLSLAVAR